MAESVIATKEGWGARFAQAAPGAVLTVVLAAVLAFFGWLAITLVDLNSRVTRLEAGQRQTNARLTRLETRVDEGFQQTNARIDDLYTRMNDIHLLLSERLPPPPGNPPQR